MSKEEDIERVMKELKQKGELSLSEVEKLTPAGVPIFLMLHELRLHGCRCEGKWPILTGGAILGNVTVTKIYPPEEG